MLLRHDFSLEKIYSQNITAYSEETTLFINVLIGKTR